MNSVTASCASSSIVVAPTGSPRLMPPEVERADRIGEFWSYPQSRTFAELPIDCEEDRTLRAHATTLRFNAVQVGGSADPDDWCHHDREQHRRVMLLESTS